MRMWVKIHKKYYPGRVVGGQGLNGEDRGLSVGLSSAVKTIQVVAESVHPVSPVEDAVRVHQRYDQKHKIPEQRFGPFIFRKEKIDDSFQCVARWGLSRMYSAGQKHIRFAEFEGSSLDLIVGEKRFGYAVFFLLTSSAVFSESQQLHRSGFDTLNKQFVSIV